VVGELSDLHCRAILNKPPDKMGVPISMNVRLGKLQEHVPKFADMRRLILTGVNMTTTKEQRRQHVATMRANFGIENMQPDAEDFAWQERYIEGAASLDDLLTHARTFAEKRRKREEASDFARASVGLEGFKPTETAEALTLRYIRGEISLDEAIKQRLDEAADSTARTGRIS
jgi:hypothetical protein